MASDDIGTYFFYGTLIDPEIRAAVLGGTAEDLLTIVDTLRGWRAVLVSGKTYPVIVPSARDEVRGVRVAIAAPSARRRLSHFEGPEYRVATLILGSGEEAEVFVGSKLSRPGAQRWNFQPWERRHKARFLARIRSAGRA